MNRDASADRSPSHMGLRGARCPAQTTVGGEVVVNMPREMPAVAAANARHRTVRVAPRNELLVPPTQSVAHGPMRSRRAGSAREGGT